jgi:hypothetical protein
VEISSRAEPIDAPDPPANQQTAYVAAERSSPAQINAFRGAFLKGRSAAGAGAGNLPHMHKAGSRSLGRRHDQRGHAYNMLLDDASEGIDTFHEARAGGGR